MAMIGSIYDPISRLKNKKRIDGAVWFYEDTFDTRRDAEEAMQEYKEEGWRVRIIKSRSYDSQYHAYIRKP